MAPTKTLTSWIFALLLIIPNIWQGPLFGDIDSSSIPAKIPHEITVIGTGYVGLVCGAGLAEFGHRVICTDIDQLKIQKLQNGIIPIYEPGLKELVQKNVAEGRLQFTYDVPKAIQQSEIIFVAVGTPQGESGQADLSYVESAARTIGHNLNSPKTICIKSTVPIGSCQKIRDLIAYTSSSFDRFELIFNPEFLREGSAVHDFFEPDRVIIGCVSNHSQEVMNEVFSPLLDQRIPFLYTSLESAESIKYASNAFLAVKISFINEMANLCDLTGADVLDVALGMGLDKRIGLKFLSPGPGFGGSCFPKDTLALLHTARMAAVEMKVLEAAVHANELQKLGVLEKAKKLVDNNLQGKIVGVLGLAFKPNTDDVRSAPSITIIEGILKEGGTVKAYDPEAMENMQHLFPGIRYETDPYGVAVDADVIIVLTEWEEFISLDLQKIKSLMNSAALVDTRNIYDPETLKQLGFKFTNTGRPSRL